MEVTNLQDKYQYEFRVLARNAAGFGPPSDVSKTVLLAPKEQPPSPPGQPNIEKCGKTYVNLRWDEPYFDGGCKINGYIVERREIVSAATIRARSSLEGRRQSGIEARRQSGIEARRQSGVEGRRQSAREGHYEHSTYSSSYLYKTTLIKSEAYSAIWIRDNDNLITHNFYTVAKLPENSEYEFRVIACNDIGNSDPSPSTGVVKVQEIIGIMCLKIIFV